MENENNIVKNEEHDHFLRWYQDKADEIYRNYESALNDKSLIVPHGAQNAVNKFPERNENEKLYSYYLRADYTFASAFAPVYCDGNSENELDDGLDVVRSFFLCRTEFLKLMNLIDSLTVRICDNNIDRSVFKFGFNTKRAREAFIWLMCTSTPAMMLDVQDLNRLKSFFIVQIERKLASGGKYYDNSDIKREFSKIMSTLDMGSVSDDLNMQEIRRDQTISVIADFKKRLQTLINETFDVYDCLSSYRDYLVETEFVPQKNDLNPVRHAIMLATTVKKIFTERFSCYLKIPKMSLGHSKLSGVYFSRSNISESNFINSEFKYSRLDNAIADDCDFSICNFMNCDAQNATLNNCTFNYSNMSGMNLAGASINGSSMNAVIFRDGRLDSSIGFAKYLLSSGGEASEAAFVKRLEELAERNSRGDEERGKEILRNFHEMLARKNEHAEGSLWKLTCADENDTSAHLWSVDAEGNVSDKTKTVVDGVFFEAKNKLAEVADECRAKVISKELLDMLRQAERDEAPKDRYDRIRKYGKISFDATTLSGADVIKSSLPAIDLSHMDVRGASFRESDLSGSMGYYTDAETAFFGNANVSAGDFYRANFNDTNFSGANCIGTSFIDCSLRSVDMNKALAIGVSVVGTQKKVPYIAELLVEIGKDDPDYAALRTMTEYVKDSVDFEDEGLIMTESNWNGASASKSMFMNAKMDRSHFNGTDFRDFLIFDCVARWSSFEKADLSYGLLIGSTFHQSIYRSAVLSQTHLYACEFSGCRMTDLMLIGSKCDKVVFQDNDLSRANFSHALFQNCIFKDCIFDDINMSKATFINCTFSNVDFTHNCIGLSSVNFKRCWFNKIKGMTYDNGSSSDMLGLEIEKTITLYAPDDGSGTKVRLKSDGVDVTHAYDLYSTTRKG